LPASGPRQIDNALALESAGAAVAMPEEQLTLERLAEQARNLLTDAELRVRMADAARRRGRPDAAAAIVDDLFGWLGVPTQGAPDTHEDPPPAGDESIGAQPATAGAASTRPIRRRPKVKRAELSLRPVARPLDAVQ